MSNGKGFRHKRPISEGGAVVPDEATLRKALTAAQHWTWSGLPEGTEGPVVMILTPGDLAEMEGLLMELDGPTARPYVPGRTYVDFGDSGFRGDDPPTMLRDLVETLLATPARPTMLRARLHHQGPVQFVAAGSLRHPARRGRGRLWLVAKIGFGPTQDQECGA